MKVASVDIGTNTVRCLIADVREGVLTPRAVFRDIVRLGGGLRERGGIDPAALERLSRPLAQYAERIREAQCRRVRVVGTSAMRDTKSDGSVQRAVQKASGFPVDIITGEEEARLTAMGVLAGVDQLEDGLVVDIGGGSTEIVRVLGGAMTWWESLPAGVVHLTEELIRNDPPTRGQVDALRRRFRKVLRGQPDDGGRRMAGTAGTPTTLAAVQLGIDDYDPTLVNGHVLSRAAIDEILERFLATDRYGRLDMPGMEKGREDLIVAGTVMVQEIMDRWSYGEMIVSDWGLLEGVAIDLAGREEGRGKREES